MVGEICWSLVTLFRVKKFYVQTLSVADLHCNSYIVTLSNFLHSHAVFGIIWQNNRLAPNFLVGATSEKCWIRRCLYYIYS